MSEWKDIIAMWIVALGLRLLRWGLSSMSQERYEQTLETIVTGIYEGYKAQKYIYKDWLKNK